MAEQITGIESLPQTNEVIVYRLMMYANPLLVVQAMSKGQSVYYSTQG